MTIKDNVGKIATKIRDEVNLPQKPTTDKVKALGLRAIDGGSSDWLNYMMLFADPAKPQQLARLLPSVPDAPGTALTRRDTRAYLVAAGPCTPDTVANLENAVSIVLDEGLEP